VLLHPLRLFRFHLMAKYSYAFREEFHAPSKEYGHYVTRNKESNKDTVWLFYRVSAWRDRVGRICIDHDVRVEETAAYLKGIVWTMRAIEQLREGKEEPLIEVITVDQYLQEGGVLHTDPKISTKEQFKAALPEAVRNAPLKVEARWSDSRSDVETAIAVNPGDWFGEVYLVYVGDCYCPPRYAVEADDVSAAIDEYIDSDYGKVDRIDIEADGADYAYECNPGDIMGGVDINEKGWINLKGEFVSDPKVGEHLREPSVTGSGTPYDSDNIYINDLKNCRYYARHLPPEGVEPEKYSDYDDPLN
jgi:hypothetical protein